jgi:Protein of unknown function (DUF2877)
VPTLPAHLVATPVLERLTGEVRGTVLGAASTAAWIDLDGFVVAITTREIPLLPNAITLVAGSGALAGAGGGSGGTARLGPGRVALGSLQVTWDPAAPPSWDPTVQAPVHVSPAVLAARGAAILDALGSRDTPPPERAQGAVDNLDPPLPASATLPVRGPTDPEGGGLKASELVRELARIGLVTAADPDGAAGVTWLFQAVGERDPELALAAVRVLLGRGPGLTPEGDDLLAGVAGTLAVLGPAIVPPSPASAPVHVSVPVPADAGNPPDPPWNLILAALRPLPGRTTVLSATLLGLALDRRLPEPAGRLLDLSPAGERAWPTALTRLERLGHGSGRAYAAGIAATACLLGAFTPARR